MELLSKVKVAYALALAKKTKHAAGNKIISRSSLIYSLKIFFSTGHLLIRPQVMRKGSWKKAKLHPLKKFVEKATSKGIFTPLGPGESWDPAHF